MASWFGLASGFRVRLDVGVRHWFGVGLGIRIWHGLGFGFGFIRLGDRVQNGVGLRRQAWCLGSARRQDLGFSLAPGFGVGLVIKFLLGVMVWRQGLARYQGSESGSELPGFGVVGVQCRYMVWRRLPWFGVTCMG